LVRYGGCGLVSYGGCGLVSYGGCGLDCSGQNKAESHTVLVKVMTFHVYYSTQFLAHLSDHQLLKSNPVAVHNYLGRARDLYIDMI
jgi:hypothetical protein